MSNIEKYDKDLPSFKIDWLHGTLPEEFDVDNFLVDLNALDPEKLSIDNFIPFNKGIYNYNSRLGINGKGWIQVAWIQDEEHSTRYAVKDGFNPGIFFIISGDGIRYLGATLFLKVCQLLKSKSFRCSRIDLACDLYDPANPYIPLYIESFKNFVSYDYSYNNNVFLGYSRKHYNIYGYYDEIRHRDVINITQGHKASEWGMLRIYDKYYECFHGRHKSIAKELVKDCPCNYWYRIEFEMHQAQARILFNDFVLKSLPASRLFYYAVQHYRIGISNGRDVKSNNPIYDDFLKLILASEEKSDFVQFVVDKFVEDDLPKKRNYFRSIAPILALFSLFEAYDPDFYNSLIDVGSIKLSANPKYKSILNNLDDLYGYYVRL